MDPVTHFELPATNVERARKFYADVFGWQVTPVPELQYTTLGTTPVDAQRQPTTPGAINGGMFQRGARSPASVPVVTIKVANIDASVKKVEAKGGKVTIPKGAVGDLGHVAYFQDPEGNIVGLWQDAPQRR